VARRLLIARGRYLLAPVSAVEQREGRLLRLIALERAFRTLVLATVGVVLLVDRHANWGREATRLARGLGLDPSGNGIHHLISAIGRVSPQRYALFGALALGYAALEGVEAYGLWRARRWAEYLTVLATSLLLVPEVWELTRSVTLLKLGGLLVNLAIVAYLVWRLRREEGARG
jgi:uncharacterized membrane protein (DUF2068 family)